MKKRALSPIKILAFAVTAGCTAPEPVNAPQHVAPAEATTAPPTPPPATEEPREKPLPIDIGNPNINTLRAELAKDDKALERVDHYRPLCDKDGYPLVGNLQQKGRVEFEPSHICRAIREKGKAP